jgi:hypothetical protein
MNVNISTTNSHYTTGLSDPSVTLNDPTEAKGDETLTVSFTMGKENGIFGEGYKITLQLPINGQDIPFTELEQACKDLGMTPLELQAALGGVLKSVEMAGNVGKLIAQLGIDYVKANIEQVIGLLDKTIEVLEQNANRLYEVMANSNYPDFTQFLKLMLQTALDLRELAAEAKLAAINGQYDLIMVQAENMRDIADKNFESAKKQIEAEKTEAIFNLVGGCLSFLGAIGGFSAAGTISTTAGGALGQIMGASGTIHTSGMKLEAATLKKAAEYLEAANKALDAENKKLENAQSIAEELKEIAKTLQDMVLRLYQDFLSAHMQVVQHANI